MPVPAFAVLCTYSLLCPSTDAIMGSATSVVARFPTKSEADAYAAKATSDGETYGDGERYWVEIRPYRDGGDETKRPMHSMPELIADDYAQRRDLGAPDWAL